MNKRSQKKVTKRNGSKNKTGNDAAEVFVLPPNLLEQLGINLKNIGSASQSTEESQVTDLNLIPKEKVGNVNKNSPKKHFLNKDFASAENQSSIIETANLMKKSVFLSPTFISNNTNSIQGEIEIVGNAEYEDLSAKVIIESNNKNAEEVLKTSVTVSDVHSVRSTPISLPTQQNKECDNAANVNVQMHDIEMQTLIDDHADEAYSSDCSNSTIGISLKTDIKKSNHNKINIISEQIILPSQDYTFGSGFTSQENNLVHVSMDTLIKSRKKNSPHLQNYLNMDVIPNVSLDTKPNDADHTNECTSYMYEENCISENKDNSTLDTVIVPNNDKIDACVEINETKTDFITPYTDENPSHDDIIIQMHQTDAIMKDKMTVDTSIPWHDAIINNCLTVDTDVTMPWHVDDASKIMNKSGTEVGNESYTKTCNVEEIENTDVMTINSSIDVNERVSSFHNSTSHERKSEKMKDVITEMIFVSNVEKESENIKNLFLENMKPQLTQTTDAIVDVNLDVGITIPWHVDSDVSKTITKKGKEDVTNIEQCNGQNEDGAKDISKVVPTDSCADAIEAVSYLLNVPTHESKFEMVKDDIPAISLVSNNEKENKNINSSLENVISYVPQTTDAIINNNVTVNTGTIISWHVESDDASKIMNIIEKEDPNVPKTEICNDCNEDEGIETFDVTTRDLCADTNEMISSLLNITSYESISKIVDDNVTSMSPVSHIEKERKDIKTSPPKSQTNHMIINDNVTEDIARGAQWHVNTDDARININEKGKRVGNEMNTETCNEHYEDEGETYNETSIKSCMDTVDAKKEIVDPISNIKSHERKSKRVEDDTTVKNKNIKNSTEDKNFRSSTGEPKSPAENVEKKIFSSNIHHLLNEDVSLCKDHYQKLSTEEDKKSNSIHKDKRSRNTSQTKRQKQRKQDEHTCIQSPILKTDNRIKQARGIQSNEKEIFECSQSNENTGNHNDVSFAKSNNVKVDHASNDSIVLNDRIREIAQCLSQIADLKKQNNFKVKRKICNSKTLSNKKYTAYSKSIHGVEKPGGSGINNEMKRKYPPTYTYERKGRQRCKTAPSYPFKESETNVQSTYLINNSSSSNTCVEMEFCLCYDFGRLLPYDDDNNITDNKSYEHIHFWNNTRTDCTPDLIFSIYSEDTFVTTLDEKDDKDDDDPSASSLTPFRKLCWNELKFLDENKIDDVDDLYFHVKRKEENYCQERGENIVFMGNQKNVESACSASGKNKNVAEWKNKTNTTVNFCEITGNNKNATEEYIEKTGKKRKCTITPSDNEEQPEKKYGLTSKAQIKGTSDSPINYRTTVNNGKDSAIIQDNRVKYSCRPIHGNVTNLEEEQSAALNKCESTKQRKPKASAFSEAQTIPEHVDTSNQRSSSVNKTVICGVCQQNIECVNWMKHIASQHNYLAWKCGEPSLDVENEAAVRDHLSHISKTCGGLECVKCGVIRKHVKAYLSHIRQCSVLDETSSEVVSEIKNEELYIKKEEKPIEPDLIKCGVCEESMRNKDWNDHNASVHNYLAWKFGKPSLDVNNEEAVREHLYTITKANGGLRCAKCGLTRKYVKAYLSHIRSCIGLNESQNDSTYNVDTLVVIQEEESTSVESNIVGNDVPPDNTDIIKCGVCEESLQVKHWNNHIGSRHDYLAWKFGDSPLDVNDEAAVRDHLYAISKTCGGLTCAKCGLVRKYVKAYLSHVKSCDGLSDSQNDSAYNISTDVPPAMDSISMPTSSIIDTIDEEQKAASAKLVECGVCKEILEDKNWYNHIASRHDYLAWKLAEPTLDINDEEAVKEHLYEVTKACGGLTCSKCGRTRRYVKSYLTHFKDCNGPNDVNDSSASVDPSLVSTNVEPVTPAVSELVKCGVCGQYMESDHWVQHIATDHEYLAWREGEPSFNVTDENQTRPHLQNLITKIGALSCPKCGLQRKYVKSYLHHIKICGGEKEYNHEKANDSQIEEASSFKCGVCNQLVESSSWPKHLSEQHNYLAWKHGDTPPNMDDENEVYRHLYNYCKEFGGLICKLCGKSRKHVKPYLEHMKTCNEEFSQNAEEVSVDTSNTTVDFDDPAVDFDSGGTCAVCHKEIEAGQWIPHTQKEHRYLAWREGEKPWDLNDSTDVNKYLYVINKKMDGLTCSKCGLVRKYVKTFLTHIKSCKVSNFNVEPTVPEGGELRTSQDTYQCAMCKEFILPAEWNTHSMKKHYNVTWIIGQTPIDIKNPYVIDKYIKEYKQIYGNLKCRTCGVTRASYSGFYAHIITCGKTEEEIDMFKELCEICNNKYLCIYRNQHAMAHRVQSYQAELKLKKEDKKKEESMPLDTSGKRRAAVKARSVIENYSSNMSKHLYTCELCGFGTDFKDELQKHKCQDSNEKDFSEDESSAAEIESSGDESPDTDVDSNISNEVNDNSDDEENEENGEPQGPKKKIRYREPAPLLSKVTRIPFEVEDPASFIKQGDLDFCHTHLSDDVLFPQWRREFETIPEVELPRYMPPLEQSCKVKSASGWTTLDRFQAKKDSNGISIFVGASIHCISWVPLRVEHIYSGSSNFLAIACHNGSDCPRYQGDETSKHENMIQIWNFSTFKVLPQLYFGIAHDFGTVWSMDWCPSGARDLTPGGAETTARLGLLAIACSSGSAYIFAVPYPSTNVNNLPIHKLKPVAELRMTMGSQRKQYQATAVSWSKQKEHNIVVVGYADGSLAYYDLHTTSPLLCTTEDDVQVFYPYHDDRAHNTCITGTDLYPAAGVGRAGGAGTCASAAPTGAYLTARAGAGGPGGRARLHVAALGIVFAPHAAAAVLAGDDAIMHTTRSELVWVQPGRRLGSVRAAAGCARCGRVAASMPPTLRVMHVHPAYPEPRKLVVGMLTMSHFAKKRKQVNDELAMTIEPLTYDEAITKYGIEFEKVAKTDRATQQHCTAKPKSHYPERFPLADVKSMAFCPSRKYHDKLAVATHSGILFLMNLD